MKFKADVIFEEFPYLFCQELDEGFQIFKSWEEFLTLYIEHMHKDNRPLYVNKAELYNRHNIFVDTSQFVVIPWDELENYI